MQSFLGGRILVDWAEIAVAEPLVRKLAGELIGRDPGPLHHNCPFCGSVEHGRPYVDGPVHVSVAHAPGLTIAAVSDTGPVGVDVGAGSDGDWVRREAVGKALGVGIVTGEVRDPVWEETVLVPGHVAVVVLVSEQAVREAAARRPMHRTES